MMPWLESKDNIKCNFLLDIMSEIGCNMSEIRQGEAMYEPPESKKV